jgi:hypothetical protein
MERAAIERDVRNFLVDEFFRGDKFSILDSRSCLTGSIEIDAALYGEAAERSKRCVSSVHQPGYFPWLSGEPVHREIFRGPGYACSRSVKRLFKD